MVSAAASNQADFVVEKMLEGRWQIVSSHPNKTKAAEAAKAIIEIEENMQVRIVGPSTEGSERQSEGASNAANERNLRILIAEDDPINQRVVVGLLSKIIPCQCDVVENGAEAVAALMRSSYDIVLMDIQMPVMDGVTATQEIRSLGGTISQVPIVAVTANVDQRDREEYLAAGMDDYVSKPINSKCLLAAISRCTG